MPLEVRELLIRALVDPTKNSQGNASTPASSGGGDMNSNKTWEFQKSLLDQFNKVLKKKKER